MESRVRYISDEELFSIASTLGTSLEDLFPPTVKKRRKRQATFNGLRPFGNCVERASSPFSAATGTVWRLDSTVSHDIRGAFGVRRLVAAFFAGRLVGQQGASSTRYSVVASVSAFDGDKSPAQSGDKSPHSKHFATSSAGNQVAGLNTYRQLAAEKMRRTGSPPQQTSGLFHP